MNLTAKNCKVLMSAGSFFFTLFSFKSLNIIDNSYDWLMDCSKNAHPDSAARERLRLEIVKGQEAYHEIEDKLLFYNLGTKLIGTFCNPLKDIFKGEYQSISRLEITNRQGKSRINYGWWRNRYFFVHLSQLF